MSKGKLAVITGASSGIGKQCAYKLACAGFDLLLVARNKSKLLETVKHINNSFNVECNFIVGDITQTETITNIKAAIENKGGLSILVNNAGGVQKSLPLDLLELDDWHYTFELNFFSIVNLVNALIPLINTNGQGRIINISSINAKVPGFMNPHYSSAKSALNNFTKYLSNFLAKENITVNSISPGIIETESWTEHIRKQAKERHMDYSELLKNETKYSTEKIPMGRLGQAKDIANFVAYLSSDQASYITGSDFVIDGGKRNEL